MKPMGETSTSFVLCLSLFQSINLSITVSLQTQQDNRDSYKYQVEYDNLTNAKEKAMSDTKMVL